jgi:hypothetical protein
VIGVLTVAYCRVSTEEQATEGFSIEGQAEKLRAYASLNDLGEVMVIADPVGRARTWSGLGCNSSSPWSRRATCRMCSCGDSIACRATSET